MAALLCTRPIDSCLEVRGMGVGCEAPHLQSILRIFRMGFRSTCSFYESAYIYGPSRRASVITVGALWFVAVVPFTAGRCYRSSSRGVVPLSSESTALTTYSVCLFSKL